MTRVDDIKACQRIIGTTPDGDFGRKSEDALIGYFRAAGLLGSPTAVRTAPAEIRARIVGRAISQLTWPGEDADPDVYARQVAPELVGTPQLRGGWCGIFALWCYVNEVPACAAWRWKVGSGFALPYGMRMVSLPEPGDLVYWEYLNGVRVHHYAIVRDVKDGIVYSIDGNQGISPRERVEERDRSIVHTKPVFFSIGAFL